MKQYDYIPGTLELDDLGEIWKAGERRGEEFGISMGYQMGFTAGRQQKRFVIARSNICIGMGAIVILQVAARLFVAWWMSL